MASLFPMPKSHGGRLGSRAARHPKISFEHWLRAAQRSVSRLIDVVRDSSGARAQRAQKRNAMRLAAHEAQARADAIDSSIGAMSTADIQRVLNRPPERRS